MKGRIAVAALMLVIGATLSLAQESDHDSHEHEEHFEQAAVYNMTVGNNSIIVVPGGDATSFAEDIFAFMVMPAATADEDGLERAEEIAVTAWEAFHEGMANGTILAAGEAATPSVSIVYEIALEGSLVQVFVTIDTERAYALFVEHGSDEVSVVVTSPSGVVVTSGAVKGGEEEDHDHEEEEDHEDHGEDNVEYGNEDEEEVSPATAAQWGNAIVASLVISILCRLAVIIADVSRCTSNETIFSGVRIFAAGALLAASLLHIVPESLEGLESDFNDLREMVTAASTAILGGILLRIVLKVFRATGHTHMIHALTPTSPTTDRGEDPAGNNTNDDAETPEARGNRDVKPVYPNLIIGPLLHNFVDGITIGATFLGCSSTIGWTVTASIVLHEVTHKIPHELANSMVPINGDISMMKAFVFFAISALSSVLGAVISLVLPEALTTAGVVYYIDLVGVGSFFFIALAELIPEGLQTRHWILLSQALKLLMLLAGASVVGIPLIFDQHC